MFYYFSCLQGPNPTPVWELNGRTLWGNLVWGEILRRLWVPKLRNNERTMRNRQETSVTSTKQLANNTTTLFASIAQPAKGLFCIIDDGV